MGNITTDTKRFHKSVRFTEDKLLPYRSYLTDHKTGLKFSNCFETEHQARVWLEKSIEILTNSSNI